MAVNWNGSTPAPPGRVRPDPTRGGSPKTVKQVLFLTLVLGLRLRFRGKAQRPTRLGHTSAAFAGNESSDSAPRRVHTLLGSFDVAIHSPAG